MMNGDEGEATIAAINVLIHQITETNPLIFAGLVDTILACAAGSDAFGRKSLLEYADSLESIYPANHRLSELEKQNAVKDLHLLLLDVQADNDARHLAETAQEVPDESSHHILDDLPPSVDNTELLEKLREMESTIDELQRELEARDRTIEHLHQRIHTLTEITEEVHAEVPPSEPEIAPEPHKSIEPIDLMEANERMQEEMERFHKRHQDL